MQFGLSVQSEIMGSHINCAIGRRIRNFWAIAVCQFHDFFLPSCSIRERIVNLTFAFSARKTSAEYQIQSQNRFFATEK